MNKPFKSYTGGKNGSGTYQTIINHIPPHKYFFSLFLGNCAITRLIRPAVFSYLVDIDPVVLKRWKSLDLRDDKYMLIKSSALSFLKYIANDFPKLCKPSDCFIFLDPPYLKSTRRSDVDVYNFEMDFTDHADLLSQVIEMSGNGYNFMICCYPNVLYTDFLKDWHYVDYQSNTRSGMAIERIYFNYVLGDKLHDYRYLGADFRARERVKRIKNNMLLKLSTLEPMLRNSIISDINTYFNF